MARQIKPRHVSSVRVEVVDRLDRIERGLRVGILAVESEGLGTCSGDGEALAMHLIEVFGEVVEIRQTIENYIQQTERG